MFVIHYFVFCLVVCTLDNGFLKYRHFL